MKLRFVSFHTKDGRNFRPGEEYTADGDRYLVKVPCSCAGVGYKSYWYYNITISGHTYAILEEFVSIVDESNPVATPVLHISDRLAEVGSEPNPRFEERRPDNYHPEAELKRFNDLAKVDWRENND